MVSKLLKQRKGSKMPRYSVGKNKSAGESKRVEILHSVEQREAVAAVLHDGESISEFTREAWRYLIEKRKRDAKKESR